MGGGAIEEKHGEEKEFRCSYHGGQRAGKI